MSGKACDFVPELLGWDSCHVTDDFFVDVEVSGHLDVVFFDELPGCSLDGFCSDSAHSDL